MWRFSLFNRDAFSEIARLVNVVATLDSDSDTAWFDTGTPDSLADAADHVRSFQQHHEQLLGSPEASAYQAGFIDQAQLIALAEPLHKSTYGKRLLQLAKEKGKVRRKAGTHVPAFFLTLSAHASFVYMLVLRSTTSSFSSYTP